jgi:hypothetical protein
LPALLRVLARTAGGQGATGTVHRLTDAEAAMVSHGGQIERGTAAASVDAVDALRHLRKGLSGRRRAGARAVCGGSRRVDSVSLSVVSRRDAAGSSPTMSERAKVCIDCGRWFEWDAVDEQQMRAWCIAHGRTYRRPLRCAGCRQLTRDWRGARERRDGIVTQVD